MPDNKNIDQLFHSTLNDMEVQPSEAVWEGIADALPQGKRKKAMALLSIAASIALFIVVGVIFLPVKPVKKNKQAVNRPKYGTNSPADKTIVGTPAVVANMVTKSAQKVKVHHHIINKSRENATAQLVKVEDTLSTQPVLIADTENQPLQQPGITDAVLKPGAMDSIPKINIAHAQSVVNDNARPDIAKEHRIRGIGGLLNVVIASVDKRKDKIMEFTDTDEGNSLTGINLGFIKIKKER